MDMTAFYPRPDEKPLDHMVTDGGFCSIFRSIACVGDSLSSGEFEGTSAEGNTTYHDMFEYSWGQYMARAAGCLVRNFSRGGMTAKEYCETFADTNGLFDASLACSAYILALGVNDVSSGIPLGSAADIKADWRENEKTFAGYYGAIVQRYKAFRPDAKFFFMTMPRESGMAADRAAKYDAHRELLYTLAAHFDNAYVLDLRAYAPVYDEQFRRHFYLGGHLNPAGYVLISCGTILAISRRWASSAHRIKTRLIREKKRQTFVKIPLTVVVRGIIFISDEIYESRAATAISV